MKYFRVTLTYAGGDTINDIVIEAESVKDARSYVEQRRIEQQAKSFSLTPISQTTAESIIDGGGISW